MKNIGELDASGYGIMVFSPERYNQFLKGRKCRARKNLDYFNKNKEVFFDLIRAWKSELQLALNMINNGNKAKPHAVRTVGGKEIRLRF